jgi:hypothetical protein
MEPPDGSTRGWCRWLVPAQVPPPAGAKQPRGSGSDSRLRLGSFALDTGRSPRRKPHVPYVWQSRPSRLSVVSRVRYTVDHVGWAACRSCPRGSASWARLHTPNAGRVQCAGELCSLAYDAPPFSRRFKFTVTVVPACCACLPVALLVSDQVRCIMILLRYPVSAPLPLG